MKNLQGRSQKPQLGKKIKVGRSPSLSASRPPPRDELGISDKNVSASESFLTLFMTSIVSAYLISSPAYYRSFIER